mmetsp:Transcript_6714/g.12414  ORF Transcript_6714/g.12414 Transcript_6714/m.12414 type:complete len:82 (+) Transcript_6714:715-960(+)
MTLLGLPGGERAEGSVLEFVCEMTPVMIFFSWVSDCVLRWFGGLGEQTGVVDAQWEAEDPVKNAGMQPRSDERWVPDHTKH